MKDFAKKMMAAFWMHPQIMVAAFIVGLLIGSVLLMVTHPWAVRMVLR